MSDVLGIARRIVGLATIVVAASLAGGFAVRHASPDPDISSEPTGCGLTVRGGATAAVEVADRGKVLSHVFVLENDTTKPVTILGVQASCSCSAADISNTIVLPGEEARLPVVVNNFPSEARKSVTTYHVQTSCGVTTLRLEAMLPLPSVVMIRPDVVYLDALPGDRVVRRVVVIRVPRQCAIQLSGAAIRRTGCEGVDVSIHEVEDSEIYKQYRLDFRCPVELAARGGGTLEVDTGCESVAIRVVGASAKETRP